MAVIDLETMIDQLIEILKAEGEYEVYSEDVSFNFTHTIMIYIGKKLSWTFGDDKVSIDFDNTTEKFSAVLTDSVPL